MTPLFIVGEHNRHRGNIVVLHRLYDDADAEGERDPRVLQHHPHHATVQAHSTLARSQDPCPHVQGQCPRAQSPHFLPHPRHRRVRVTRLLRREDTTQSQQRLRLHPGGTVVGHRNDDDRWLRRHGTQDLPRHVRRVAVRAHGRAYHSASGSGDRFQLRPLLLTHAGASQAAQEAATRTAG